MTRRTSAPERPSNLAVLDELSRSLVGKPVKADFSDLVGVSAPDPEFDELIASQRRIDPDMWK